MGLTTQEIQSITSNIASILIANPPKFWCTDLFYDSPIKYEQSELAAYRVADYMRNRIHRTINQYPDKFTVRFISEHWELTFNKVGWHNNIDSISLYGGTPMYMWSKIDLSWKRSTYHRLQTKSLYIYILDTSILLTDEPEHNGKTGIKLAD